ncbi:BTAD domain-containing putative transcriptional regulator [Streptomyces cyanogenus]|uniref:BTAD domain-containing putative transcriptional regulator n=1 Tax=Streptomyces cyanogenus TaxID=80860 RepID=UPI001AA0D0F2|nr:BTAD domain-containing putative transcriptional regulator [Streptomyces cyanogenus]
MGGINQRATLGLLLLNANQVVPTSQVIDALWGMHAPATSRKMVQNAASSLRRIIAEHGGSEQDTELLTRSPGYLLTVPRDAVDLYIFQRLSKEGRAALAAGAWASAARSLREALALWRGPALCDLAETGINWPELSALESARGAVAEDLYEAELCLGRHHDLVSALEPLVEAAPDRERLCGLLMLALYRCGRQREALTVYQRTRKVLRTEFGLEPGRDLQELEHKILNHDTSLVFDRSAAVTASGRRSSDPASPTAVREPAPAPESSAPPEPAVPYPMPAAAPAARPAAAAVDSPSALLSGPYRTERKWVSVLTARALLTSVDDPEQIDGALKAMTAAVMEEGERFGGVLQGRMGAQWWVLFGAPHTRENDPERATRAALALQDRFRQRGPGQPPAVSLRVAVATGEVMMTYGAPGDTRPSDVIGGVLDTCQRLLEEVPAGGVRVCEHTSRVTRDAFEYAGADEPVAERATPPGTQLSDGFRLSPFIGREAELETLCRLLRTIRSRRRPHLVTLLGEPGIGKSRLVHELAQYDAGLPESARWLVGRVSPFGCETPLGALSEMVRGLLGITDSDSAAATERTLADAVDRLTASPDERAVMLRRLRPLLGLEEDDPAPAGCSPEAKAESFAVWCKFLEEIAAEQPLVAVLEDLHLADDILLDFVGYLTDHVGAVPILVIATARPELLRERPHWGGGKRNATTLTLAPLTREESGLLLNELATRYRERERLPSPPPGSRCADPDGFGAALISQMGGNPLFAWEFIRMYHDCGRSGAPVVPAGPEHGHPPLPQSVYAVIAARLDRLAPEDKEVLYDAAVFGNKVWVDAVAALNKRAPGDVAASLRRLEHLELLRRIRDKSVPDGVAYVFRHELVLEVAYSHLPRAVRAAKHLRAAAWLESLPTHRADLLAVHYELAASASEDGSADNGRLSGHRARRIRRPAHPPLAMPV